MQDGRALSLERGAGGGLLPPPASGLAPRSAQWEAAFLQEQRHHASVCIFILYLGRKHRYAGSSKGWAVIWPRSAGRRSLCQQPVSFLSRAIFYFGVSERTCSRMGSKLATSLTICLRLELNWVEK